MVAKPGHVLVKADYSQAQLRILAHLSEDEELLRLFGAGADVHGETARWLSIDRDAAKQLNFGIYFGMSGGALAGRINRIRQAQGLAYIDEGTAQGYIDGFYTKYAGVKAFFAREWDKLKALPPDQRVVSSLLGRIRRFPTRMTPQVEGRLPGYVGSANRG
jgi:DNA polymerase I